MTPDRRQVETAQGVIVEYLVSGDGVPVIMLPSLGRAAADFDEVATHLDDAGILVVRPEPRGIGGSKGPLGDDLSLSDLADDIAAVIEHERFAPTFVLGHAFGNMVARTLATDRPEIVRGVILVCPSNRAPISEETQRKIHASSDLSMPDDERLQVLGEVFFAPDSDPSPFLPGWFPEAQAAQFAAAKSIPFDVYLAAGGAPILEVHGDSDAFVPLERTGDLSDELGDQVELKIIPGAGHAMLPEQPESLAKAIAGWVHSPERD